MSQLQERVIPYVEDRATAPASSRPRPIDPSDGLARSRAKNAIQVDLPTRGRRARRRAACPSETSAASSSSTRQPRAAPACCASSPPIPRRSPTSRAQALELCHFDPDTGEDLRRAPGAREDCEAACYDCLMSYANQPDHLLLDRHAIKNLLQTLASGGRVSRRPPPRAAEQLERLLGRLRLGARASAGCDALERPRLQPADARPAAHRRVRTRGPTSSTPTSSPPSSSTGRRTTTRRQRAGRETAAAGSLEDAGYTVIRFPHDERLGRRSSPPPEPLREGQS